ncbi:helix-turn-helix transcriptional regulator with cupin domain [Syntrophotalea carbinolica DSM 2380]|uniref:Helix-turn-helix transcriptional regulator with cupin domain n=1 Tax=Syntrophotalea carbinolica (strain DSM 2380 / NBRC 103641 / GraBd1) TaxID=338963 RepID=Q3A0C6_SYNC1|nr:XRE family transcriptional regulator [Syntrophotalea carbinolica]ABA90181.1 helix-turn-helix transcriptional regulator with cupin domain [Syntrophotalea carbinolica DSM 2380]
MTDIREEVKGLQIGFKIRRLRQERRMTLQNLSEATGLSKPLLSQVENEQVIPPLATLLRIAKALKVGLHTFFQEEGSIEKCILVRAGEGGQQDVHSSRSRRSSPYEYQSLGYGKKQRSLEPFLIQFEVQPWRDDLLVSHEGEEFLYILQGQVEFHYGDEIMTVGPGDSLYYDSNEPHGYVAVGDVPARAVAVIYSQD